MHVESIDLSVKTKGPWFEAVASVKIVDKKGKPVFGAEVFGTFSDGQIGNPESTSATTDKNGIANLKIKKKEQIDAFSFRVDDVNHSSYVYNPSENLETEDTYGD
jgi:uncharacterized GH25 family protein